MVKLRARCLLVGETLSQLSLIEDERSVRKLKLTTSAVSSAPKWSRLSRNCAHLIILTVVIIIITLSGLVGDAAVGKTSLTQMFHSDGMLFQKNYSMVRALYSPP